jgi:hypothetical protein
MKKSNCNYAGKMLYNSIALFLLVSLLGCSGNTVKTELSVNKLHFQDGETLGAEKTSFGFSGSEGQSIKTKVTRELNETDEVYEYITETKTSKKYTGVIFLRHGISERADILLDSNTFFQPTTSSVISLLSIGSRCHVKYRLNPNSRAFAVSIMPGIGYTKAFEIGSGNFYASSATVNLDLNFPMSYRFTKNLAVRFGPSFSQLFQYGKSDDRTKIVSSSNNVTKFKSDYFYPGFVFGLSLAVLHPEIRFDYNDGKFVSYFGMQMRLK